MTMFWASTLKHDVFGQFTFHRKYFSGAWLMTDKAATDGCFQGTFRW
jgi:hypothetical protein